MNNIVTKKIKQDTELFALGPIQLALKQKLH